MRIAELLTSPPPATGWSLDAAMAAVVRRQAKAELRCAAVEVPDATFEVGPVGLQAVDQDTLRPILTRLQQEVEGSKRAALVLPSGWLRAHLIEFEELPRRQADLHEVVIWRLKKLLPVAPASLRLATVSQPATDGPRRLLVMVGVERALADLEAVFESVGVSLGIIIPRAFAVAGGTGTAGPVLNIQQENGFLSLVLLIDDVPHVVRTKLLAGNDWPVIERELMMTIGFIVDRLGVVDGLSVTISAEDPELVDHLEHWISSIPDLSPVEASSPSLMFAGTTVRERARPFRLDPVVNVLSGGVR
jgi:hypothetical protein